MPELKTTVTELKSAFDGWLDVTGKTLLAVTMKTSKLKNRKSKNNVKDGAEY